MRQFCWKLVDNKIEKFDLQHFINGGSMRRTMEFIGRKQLKKLTKANWKSFTQSKVSIMERDIDLQWVKIKITLIELLMSSCNEITNILLHHPTKKLKMCHIPKTLCRFTGKNYPGWGGRKVWYGCIDSVLGKS